MRRLLKHLPLIAVLLFFASSILWLKYNKNVGKIAFTDFSSHNTSNKGTSLAFKYLAARNPGRKIRRMTLPFKTARLEKNAVLFKIQPLLYPFWVKEQDDKNPYLIDSEKLLSKAEIEWVREGARLVIAASSSSATSRPPAPTVKVFPIWGRVNDLYPVTDFIDEDKLRDGHAIIIAEKKAVVFRRPVGSGEIIFISCPRIFQNVHIGRVNNLGLLEALAGTNRPVYFDEYSHFMRSEFGITSFLDEWKLIPLLLIIIAASLLFFWRNIVVAGSPVDLRTGQTDRSGNFIESLSQLYNRSLSRKQSIALYYNHLVHFVAKSTGLRGDELETKLQKLTNGMTVPDYKGADDIGKNEFYKKLKVINNAFGSMDLKN